ncbi:MAG: DUF1499 domain-containing protein [Nitrosomonas sp.]|nr:DUF1499 domain-containing protein [Nitrosomonas sp.]MDP1949599.1 DUF1499 domain-containing protein [Nitrosomonas sp.]
MNKCSGFARWSLRFALVAVVFSVVAVLGHRLGVMDFRLALFSLAGGAALGLLAVISGIIGMITTCRGKIPGIGFAWAGLILGLVVTVPVFLAIQTGTKVPSIHDITTDLQDPPKFVAIPNLRTAAHNSLDRKVPTELSALQQEGYPDLGPALISRPQGQVFEKALALVKARGWSVAAVSAEDGTIEATATTQVMGFKDDVVIRVRDETGGAIVDMRSVSRVGKNDLGANAVRIKEFLADLRSGE